MTDELEEGPVVVSRRDARAGGLTHYFTGKPCQNGHSAKRFVCSAHCTQCHLEYQIARNSDRPELNKARQRRYREKHRLACNERVRRHYAARPGLYVAKTRNRRAKARGNGGSHTVADVAAIREKQGDRCAICTKKLGKSHHVDHVIPLAAGGPNDRSNIQVTCPFCNMSKGARDPIEHAQSLGRLL